MDLEQQANRLVRAAMELAPVLRSYTPVKKLSEALKLWDFYQKKKSVVRREMSEHEHFFIGEAIAVTIDHTKPLWWRNASWALFFVARGLELATQNKLREAEKQLTFAEEELQLGASAKAMVFARTNSLKSKRPAKRARRRR